MIPNEVLKQWSLIGSQVQLGEGLINDTYCVDGQFVMQRINSRVFSKPKHVVANYRKIYNHVYDLVPELVATQDGEYCYQDQGGYYWRCLTYYPSRSFQILPDELAYSAGQAFGLFLQRLRTCELVIEPVIPKFHDFAFYLEEFNRVWHKKQEYLKRELVDRCLEVANQSSLLDRYQIIHGDCKVNNLLFDLNSNRVVRIVDIDTLMWGNPIWDFGDLVRSLMTGQPLDVCMTARLSSACKGFFEEFPIAEEEVRLFAFAPIYMSVMLGMRFLTDHARHNQYFKVSRFDENKDRALEQLNLANHFNQVYEEFHSTISSCLRFSLEDSKRLAQKYHCLGNQSLY